MERIERRFIIDSIYSFSMMCKYETVCMSFSMICETVVLLRFAFGIRLITGAAMELFKSM